MLERYRPVDLAEHLLLPKVSTVSAADSAKYKTAHSYRKSRDGQNFTLLIITRSCQLSYPCFGSHLLIHYRGQTFRQRTGSTKWFGCDTIRALSPLADTRVVRVF